MNKSTSFFSVTIIAYIIGIIAIIVCLLQGEKLSWESVTAFSIGFVTLSVAYLVVLKYLHEQTLYALGEKKSIELTQAEAAVLANRKALEVEVLANRKALEAERLLNEQKDIIFKIAVEAERLKNERIDYILKTAVEIAKMEIGKGAAGSESKSEGQGEGKSILAEKVEKIVVLISELDGDYKKSVGSLSDLNEQVKSLSKALESAIKGNMTIHDGVKGL